MKKLILKFAYVIAGVLLLAGLAFFLVSAPVKPATLDSEFFQPEKQKMSAILEQIKVFGFAGNPQNREDSLAMALDLYGMAKYEDSRKWLESYVERYPEDFTARFYLGMVHLYQDEPRNAFQILSPLSEMNNFELRDDARWYAALAASNVDRFRATGLFSLISKDPDSKYQEAAALVLSSIKDRSDTFGFKIQANGAENLAGAMVIATPIAWWQSGWIRIIMGILFPASGAGVLFWRNRIRKLEAEKAEIEQEKKVSDDLLLNILPAETAEELKKFGHSDTRRYEEVTVLFCDFKNFTSISEQLTPEELVASLAQCFEAYDHIVTTHQLEKIKTVGDCYICAGGLKNDQQELSPPRIESQLENDAIRVVKAAKDILDFLTEFNKQQENAGKPAFRVRIGIHTGPVVAGIVGVKKYAYDIWGDTVNVAARMEQACEVGHINISGTTYELVKGAFCCQYRGKVEAKGKGAVDMYFVG